MTPTKAPSAVRYVAELRGQHDLLAPPADGLAHEDLVRMGAVDVGGVQEVDPQLQGPVDRGDRLGFVAGPVELAHPHAAQPQGRHG